MKLIIAEKPSVAKQIASALGNFKYNKTVGYFEAGGWTVSFALGHIIGLAEPKDYDKELKHWRKDTLPIIPNKYKYRVTNRKRFSALKKLVQKADVIVNACDAGREGELIFREVIMLAKPKKTAVIKRMWLSAMTKDAVKKEIQNLKPISKYDLLSKSAFARAIADWLVGINATRAFTIKSRELFTIGRVQTPTLYAIINREKERAKQKETYYYQVIGTFHSTEYEGTYYKVFQSIADAQALIKVLPSSGNIKDFKEKVVSVHPQLLYNLTALQREANSGYHFSAQKTLNIMQYLYEHKFLSYPRTDSRYIPQSIVKDVYTTVAKVSPVVGIRNFGKIYSVLIDDSKVTDHYAIIPTGELNGLNSLSPDQKKIYDLVARRFVSVFLGNASVQMQKWQTVNGKHVFDSSREAVLSPGWKEVYGVKAQGKFPAMQGKHNLVKAVPVRKKKGKSPQYSDASLLAFMEHAGKYGLGTSATRASIIERLIRTKYIQRQKNVLVPLDKGYKLVNALERLNVNELLSPDLTALFEKGLGDIEKGKENDKTFISSMGKYTKQVTDKIIRSRM